MTQVIGIIPARYGSQRFPGKPLAMIKGKTLIQRTYENAKKCESLDQLIVATDDQRIFDHVTDFGGTPIMTSSSCQNGTERVGEIIKHMNLKDQEVIVVNIQGDEPLLEPEVITQVVNILQNDPLAVMSTAIMKIQKESDLFSRSVVKCVKDLNHNALYFTRSLIPLGHNEKYNEKNTYYKHLGIYAYRKEFVLTFIELPSTPLQIAEDLEQLKALEYGYKIKVAEVISRSIGIDTPEELQHMELIL